MNIGNGDIYDSIPDALNDLKRKGYKNLRKIGIGAARSMTYFVNSEGSLFGMQQYKSFLLVKKKKVYFNKKGPFVRISLDEHHELNLYLAPLLFRMFVDPELSSDSEVVFKDGNIRNYQLSNLSVEKKKIPEAYISNMEKFKQVYKCLFPRCSEHIQYITGLSKEDSQDAASVSFFELCKTWNGSNLDVDYFTRCWFKRGAKRGVDYYLRNAKNGGKVLYDDGEEIFGSPDKDVEVADLWAPLKNNPASIKYLKLRLNGYSNVEISEMCRVPYGTVGSYISIALTLLKSYFKKDVLY